MQSKSLLLLLGGAALVCTGVAVACGVLLLVKNKSAGSSSSSLSSSAAADDQLDVTETPSSVIPSFSPRPSGMRIVRFPAADPTVSPSAAPIAKPATPAPSPRPSGTRMVRFPTPDPVTRVPSPHPSHSPIAPPTIRPSSSHRPSGALTFAPFAPTVTAAPIPNTNSPDVVDIPDQSQVFRIKMNWEEDYFWQEDPAEYFWCITCAVCDELNFSEFPEEFNCQSSYCAPGDQLWLRDCQEDYGAAFRVNQDDQPGLMLEVLDSGRSETVPGQCVTRSDKRYMQVQSCDANDTTQRWRSISSTQPFPLISYYKHLHDANETYCVTQHHHPKSYELLGLKDCPEAMSVNTGLWVVYPLPE